RIAINRPGDAPPAADRSQAPGAASSNPEAIRLSVPTPSSLREPDVPSPPVARSDFGQSVTASIDDLERLGEADSSGDVEQTLIEPPGLFTPPPSADDESAITPAAPPRPAPEA